MEAILSLVDLVTEIICPCGERFYTSEFKDIQVGDGGGKRYKVKIKFREFDVEEVKE